MVALEAQLASEREAHAQVGGRVGGAWGGGGVSGC